MGITYIISIKTTFCQDLRVVNKWARNFAILFTYFLNFITFKVFSISRRTIDLNAVFVSGGSDSGSLSKWCLLTHWVYFTFSAIFKLRRRKFCHQRWQSRHSRQGSGIFLTFLSLYDAHSVVTDSDFLWASRAQILLWPISFRIFNLTSLVADPG